MTVSFAYLGIATLLVLTPGAGTAFITHVVAQYGARAARAAIAGLSMAAMTHALAATAGLSLLLAESPALARGVSLAGGSYLLYLGAVAIRANAGRSPTRTAATVPDARHIVRAGFVTNLLNAPLALFYLIVVPQYLLAGGDARVSGMLALCAAHLAIAITWQLTYVALLSRLVGVVENPRVRQRMQLVTALVLIYFGGRALLGA